MNALQPQVALFITEEEHKNAPEFEAGDATGP